MAIDRNAVQSISITLALAAASMCIAQAAEPPAAGLMREHKCYTCHADHEPLAGPAFADVAAAYRGHPDAVAVVATLIRTGVSGGGPWHMPPHPEISAAEAATIARYILSLDRHAVAPDGVVRDQPTTATSPRS